MLGPRQDRKGAYTAVNPKRIAARIDRRLVQFHRDCSKSGDFCYVANAVRANCSPPAATRRP